MLTPQEVSQCAFPKASFGGYNMAHVDEFLDALTGDYTTLYNENAVLKSKMKVLVDKVEEYRATEEAMRKALMTAQRLADDLVKEAEEKRAKILADAQAEAQAQIESLRREVTLEEGRLTAAQENTAAFVEKVRALYAQSQTFLDNLGQLVPQLPGPSAQEQQVEQTASDIDDSVQRLVAQAMADATAENQRAQQQERQEQQDLSETTLFTPPKAEEEKPARDEELDELERTSKIDFSNLQFGRDYEIK